MKQFTKKEYEKFDYMVHFKADKLGYIKQYNKDNNTNYQYVSEFIFALYHSDVKVTFIADVLEVTRASILVFVKKMGGEIKSIGGPNGNAFDCAQEDVNFIRSSKETNVALGKKYGVSCQTIGNIRRMVGRWAKI